MPRTIQPSEPEQELDLIDDDALIVPSGSTLLNLACTGRTGGAFPTKKIVNIIGDSDSGKTLVFLSSLAEAAQLNSFDDYRLVHGEAEFSSDIDVAALFGRKLADRIEYPELLTIQDFDRSISGYISEGVPFIYGLDSFDSLTSEEEMAVIEKKKQKKEGTKAYPDKARVLSGMLPKVVSGLQDTNSLLIIISQIRENIGALPGQKKYRRTGGRALKHYSCIEMWLHMIGRIKNKQYNQEIGIECRPKITKNHLTGRCREVEFPIYYDYGADDIGSMIDWMVDHGFWPKNKGNHKIKTGWRGLDLAKHNLIAKIEKLDLEEELKQIVGRAWEVLEEKLKLHRKRKYQ